MVGVIGEEVMKISEEAVRTKLIGEMEELAIVTGYLLAPDAD